jgi:hypothetical protein
MAVYDCGELTIPDLHFTVRDEIEIKRTVSDSDKVHSVDLGCQVILVDHTPSSHLLKNNG